MSLTLEMVLWILLAFFIGCILGYALRTALTGSPKSKKSSKPSPRAQQSKSGTATLSKEAEPAVASPESPEAVTGEGEGAPASPKVQVGPQAGLKGQAQRSKPPTARKSQPAAGTPVRPKAIPAPRGGTPDKLQRISGVGPKLEGVLHRLGIFHFDQIAEWTPEQQQWVDEHLKFKGRIARDEWIKQARLLANGKEEDFARLYGTVAGNAKKSATPNKKQMNGRSSSKA
jgi:predicted flap endonuclease-1-like 5' DNA nuclease